MIGAVPVFVLEGKAPSMKSNTMSKRNEIQFRGAKPRNIETNKEKSQKKTGNRSRFNAVQKQCEKLLNALGLKCVSGPGEAEAFCAYLNELKYVDGIISQDSDCFGYGATRVYRNFCISQQNTQGGSVDVYDLKKIQEVKKIGRNHIICLALLCGCDYCPEGVGGVGRDAALKLIEVYDDDKILDSKLL
ncbi:flap endonuclease GEN-like [Ctenocephalides felis]|uniref:flap endonuclease GEN-like n=1 Tax=Ctenocephalides felis TaxID=7515 RepID=UPI000E6E3F85|nr:flap endonuclease GEN-like [Ctenocephalides felis]